MFISNLRVLMAHKKLNINNVVEMTGLSQPTVSKLFNGDSDEIKTIKLETIASICKAMECTISDLIEYIP